MAKVDLRRVCAQMMAVTLLLLVSAPLILTVLRNLPVSPKNLPRWLDRHRIGWPHLSGVTVSEPDVPLSWDSIRSANFQKRKALQFDENFAGREALIRYTNELWFRLFRDTANASSTIAIGEHDVLFETTYLGEYFLHRTSPVILDAWVKELRRLQDFCRSMDMGFAVLVVPGKPSIYPEDTPRAWRRRYDPHPRAYPLLKQALQDNGVPFVDAVELIAREKTKGPPAPLFPKGGTHWNERASFIAANEVQAQFAQQHKAAEQIQLRESKVVYEPEGDEDDLLELLNLSRPWKYPCERIIVTPRASKARQLTMAVVGDSFCWNILHIFNKSGQFSDISFYFHYKLYKTRFADGRSETIRTPATPVDFNSEIFAADCLLLEINEASAVNPVHHLSAFIGDALAHLPDTAAPRPAFRAD